MATIKQRPTSRCFPSVSDVNVSGRAGGAGGRLAWADLAVAVHPPQRPDPEPQPACARQAPQSSADPQWGTDHRGTGSVTRPGGLPVGHLERSSLLGRTRPDPTAPGSRASAYAWDPAPPRSQATVIPRGCDLPGWSAETTGHDGLAEPPVLRAGCSSQVPDVALSTPASCLLPV